MAIKELNFDGVVTPLGAEAQNVEYANTAMDGVSNVKQALDAIAQGGGQSVSGVTVGNGRNMYNKADATQRLDNYNIGDNSLTPLSYNDKFAVAKIPVNELTEYIIYNPDGLWGGRRGYAFLDSSSAYIGGRKAWTVVWDSSPEYTGDDIPIDDCHRRLTTPSGCAYLAIQTAAIANSDWAEFDIRNSLMVEHGSYPSEYDDGSEQYVTHINGKRIIAANANNGEIKYDIPLNTYIMGDSTATYTEGVWPQNLVKKFSFKHFHGLAKGGATWGVRKDADASAISAGDNSGNNDNTLLAQVYKLVALVNNGAPAPELIIMHAGTNDVTAEFANGSTAMAGGANYTEVGNADTTFDYSDANYRDWSDMPIVDARTNTAIGGMRLAIETIRTNWPFCKIVVTTPLQRATNVSQDYSLLQIYRKCVEQIRKAAWYMSVPCLDLSAISGITVYNLSTFTKDSLHPNANGGKRLADVIGRYLVSHFGIKNDWYS